MLNKFRKNYRFNKFTEELLLELGEKIPVSQTAIVQMAIYHYAKGELGDDKINEVFYQVYLETEGPPTL